MTAFTHFPAKQQLVAGARRLGVLPALERVRYWREAARCRSDNAAFAAEHPGLPLPPLWWMHDMYAHCSWRQYLDTGRQAAADLMDLLARHLPAAAVQDSLSICEWGCGMGRVLRHLPARHRLCGFDYNPAAAAWCADNLQLDCRANGLMPPLAAADGAFDAVYCISVFTHLSEAAQTAWAAEIFRVLKPGGVFIATFHGAPAKGQLLPAEQQRFDTGHPVVRGNVREGSRAYAAYHPPAYVTNSLLAAFRIVHGPAPGLGQTVYVAVKP